MSKNETKAPIAIGTGLLALDVVDSTNSQAPLRYWAGGTCGNVLLALQYLGWHSKPIARLADDSTAELLLADLKKWKADCHWVSVDEDGSTPAIVHRISRNKAGQPTHSFSWRCSECGRRYPGYKPVLATTAEQIAGEIKTVNVFFFDRISRGALVLAKAAADKNALVVFEPSGTSHPSLFKEACGIAHVIKYSHDRLDDFPSEIDDSQSVRLQIETLGEHGLRYRWRPPQKRFHVWHSLDAIATDNLVDAAGAGDWTTAGLLSLTAREGLQGFQQKSAEQIEDSIRFGQALASWACTYEGARGGMYAVSKRTFDKQIKQIVEGEKLIRGNVVRLKGGRKAASSLCAACGPTAQVRKKRG